MANRTRPIRIEFCVSENEHRIIKSKMAQLGTNNMGAYLRKMAIAKVFISQAIEISENYQIDTEIRQGAGTVTVIFSFDCGGAMGFLKSVIQYVDDISFFSSTNGYEIVLALDFYTYALYRHGRKMRP